MLSTLTTRLLPRLAGNRLLQFKEPIKQLTTSTLRFAGDSENSKMGPWPATPEDRIRAARKYNLIPEDYEPYEEDLGFGDYPKLPDIGDFNKNRYDDFDDIFYSRHHGEPPHLFFDLYRWEHSDPLLYTKPYQLPHWLSFLIVISLPLGFYLCLWVPERYNINLNRNWKYATYQYAGEIREFPPSKGDPVIGGHH